MSFRQTSTICRQLLIETIVSRSWRWRPDYMRTGLQFSATQFDDGVGLRT
jgi:hypothetical protein